MQYSSKQSGFTLIEMLVSLSLFTIVMTITLGTLLILIKGNQVSVAEQSVMDTLAFSLDSMTREIRTGSFYVCASTGNLGSAVSASDFVPSLGSRQLFNPSSNHHDRMDFTTFNPRGNPKARDCVNGNEDNEPYQGISFIEGGNSISQGTDSGRIMYFFDRAENTIKRRVRNNVSEPIISESIEIVNAEFFVTGSARLRYPLDSSGIPIGVGDTIQPSVTIVIQARERGNDAAEIVTLQTTITQQSLDL